LFDFAAGAAELSKGFSLSPEEEEEEEEEEDVPKRLGLALGFSLASELSSTTAFSAGLAGEEDEKRLPVPPLGLAFPALFFNSLAAVFLPFALGTVIVGVGGGLL
jgi:hypothetical protein